MSETLGEPPAPPRGTRRPLPSWAKTLGRGTALGRRTKRRRCCATTGSRGDVAAAANMRQGCGGRGRSEALLRRSRREGGARKQPGKTHHGNFEGWEHLRLDLLSYVSSGQTWGHVRYSIREAKTATPLTYTIFEAKVRTPSIPRRITRRLRRLAASGRGEDEGGLVPTGPKTSRAPSDSPLAVVPLTELMYMQLSELSDLTTLDFLGRRSLASRPAPALGGGLVLADNVDEVGDGGGASRGAISAERPVTQDTFSLHPPYTRSPLQDSRLFGPRPWKILAVTYEKQRFMSNPDPGENLVMENLVMETGCTTPTANCFGDTAWLPFEGYEPLEHG